MSLRHSIRLAALSAALGIGAWVAGCVSEHESTTGPRNATGDCRIAVGGPIVGMTQALVAMRNYDFHPDTVRVKPGASVTWINCEDTGIDAHTSTSETGAWQSKYMSPGDYWTRTFNEVGAFPFYCEPHPFMKGVVLVAP
jgi:plastocyanin